MSTNGFLLDTTVLIDIFRGKENTVSLITKLAEELPLAVSAVTIGEIYSGIRETEQKRVQEFLDSLVLYPIDGGIAYKAGVYRRDYRKKGITLGLLDCFIAATAVEFNLTLVTKNLRHFPMLELSIIEH